MGLALARRLGTKIIDQRTGESLGRAFVFAWRGRIHVIGLHVAVRPTFLPQQRVTYWKQELGFTTHPPPDFPSMTRGEAPAVDGSAPPPR